MTQHHDTVSMASGQGEPLCILLPLGLWLEMPWKLGGERVEVVEDKGRLRFA